MRYLTAVAALGLLLAVTGTAEATTYSVTFSGDSTTGSYGFDGVNQTVSSPAYGSWTGETGEDSTRDGQWGTRYGVTADAGTANSAYIGTGTGSRYYHEMAQGWFQNAGGIGPGNGYIDAYTTSAVGTSDNSTEPPDNRGRADSGYIEALWKFENVDSFGAGYNLFVSGDDLDNYVAQKGEGYTWGEDWMVKAYYDSSWHDLGLMAIAPDATGGWLSENDYDLSGFTGGGDLIIGIDGTYWSDNTYKLINPFDGSRQSFKVSGGSQHGFRPHELTLTPVPEPVTMAGLMLGIGAIGGYVRRRRKA